MSSEQVLDVCHPSYKDRMSMFHRANEVLDAINNTLEFTSDNEKFWWDACSGMLAALLAKAGYDQQLQKRFLYSYQRVLQALGPRPLTDGGASRFSTMGVDSTPLVFSWNYDGSKSTIRYAFESYGSRDDPFAQASTSELLHRMAQLPQTEVNSELFDAIAKSLWINPENEASVLAQFPANPTAQRPCHICVGFDLLHDGSTTVKGYITTMVKSLEVASMQSQLSRELIHSLDSKQCSHTRQAELAGDLVRSLNSTIFSIAPILPAYQIIEDFTASCQDHSKQVIFMFGWDFVKPLESRLKVYVYKEKTSLRNLRDIWTQGGRLHGPGIERGLKLINELWTLIYGAPGNMPEEEELKDRHGNSHGIIGYLEIKPGSAQPVPKLYLEAGKFGRNDLEVSRKIADWLKGRDWPLGNTWVDDIQEIYSHRDLSQTKGLYNEFALSPQEPGHLSVTIYMSPLIHSSLSLSL